MPFHSLREKASGIGAAVIVIGLRGEHRVVVDLVAARIAEVEAVGAIVCRVVCDLVVEGAIEQESDARQTGCGSILAHPAVIGVVEPESIA